MVDVGDKPVTKRVAVAGGFIEMNPTTLEMIVSGTAPKGDVMAAARIAGVMAAKETSSLIPLCHPLPITRANVELTPEALAADADNTGDGGNDAVGGNGGGGTGGSGGSNGGLVGVRIRATVATDGKTGVEMEALTAAAVAALTLYDMCKAVDRGMVVRDIMLLSKEGGISGTWVREENA